MVFGWKGKLNQFPCRFFFCAVFLIKAKFFGGSLIPAGTFIGWEGANVARI